MINDLTFFDRIDIRN